MYQGLTSSEIKEKKKLGLSNQTIDSYSPTYLQIFRRNIFNIINIILFPLLLVLFSFQLYVEILAFTTFLTINTLVSIVDEIRAKRKLDKLKNEFQKKVKVIRDSNEIEIPVDEIVEGEFIVAKEGDSIVADGTILEENYLQVDESMLSGESNYLEKDKDDKVFSGSFVVTGNCIYRVEAVGNENYLNKLGTEAFNYKRTQSSLQQKGDLLVSALVLIGLILAALNFGLSSQFTLVERILSLTGIISLMIPQSMIFLFTLTFTISITKLFNKGILIQKGGSIQELSEVDTICFDKTGTLTTNKMKIVDFKNWGVDLEILGTFYNSVVEQIVSVNETQKLLHKFFIEYPKKSVKHFDQIPFTSKNKYSLLSGYSEDSAKVFFIGASSVMLPLIAEKIRGDIEKYIASEESKGNRILITGFQTTAYTQFDSKSAKEFFGEMKEIKNIIVFSIEEELNQGVKSLLSDLADQKIDVKIISGDSKNSVSRIAFKLGLNISKIIDLSTLTGDEDFDALVVEHSIFTRAKPEDKLNIVNALKRKGKKVAMVGDGINDVLGLKASDVSISMETGSKITREISDIVLLENDYQKIPLIFFEGENIIYNLKLSSKMFLAKSFMGILVTLFYSVNRAVLPLFPSSMLIFSFLGSSAPSYVIVFSRQLVKNRIPFFKEVMASSLPAGTLMAVLLIGLENLLKSNGSRFLDTNTALILFSLSISILYSIFLVWESKKLRNIFIATFAYLALMSIGIYQTILPYNQSKYSIYDQSLLLGLMFFGGLIVAIILFTLLKPKKLVSKIFTFLFSFAFIPLAYFPCQVYYQVNNLPLSTFFIIIPVSFVGIILIIGVNEIRKKFSNY